VGLPRPSTKRTLSFLEARALIPTIHGLTEAAQNQLVRLAEPGVDESSDQSGAIVDEWARAVSALGGDVKGLWLVDFDNGSGYYCWRFPETDLDFYHSYEDGFDGRMRIQ
jgi:hypothetical protein